MIRNALLLWAAAGLSASVGSYQTPGDGLTVRAVRFYMAQHDRTHVKGLVQIPIGPLLAATPAAAAVSYRVQVHVRDSTGLLLTEESWHGRAPAPSPGISPADAYAVEMIEFTVAPGRYRLDVAVLDSVTGKSMVAGTEVRSLSREDLISDLLVSPAIRAAGPGDTVPGPGELRAGHNLVTAVASAQLTPLRAKVFYLLEVYSDSDASGSISVQVQDSTGRAVVQSASAPVTVTAGGSMLNGQLDLAGLPEGRYRLTTTMELGGRKVERTAPLSMAALDETLEREATRREGDRSSDEGFFAGMSGAELNEVEAPLAYIADSRELSPWDDKLSTVAKRRFLTDFWRRRDPTPGTARNERRETFYEGITHANREYREGGRSAMPGWKSDRGRVFLKYGAPDDILRRQNEGRAPPYEVWSYSKGRGLYFLFADRTGFGTFTLIHSNDIKEPGLPGWGDIIGRPAVSDAGRWLGIDLLQGGRSF